MWVLALPRFVPWPLGPLHSPVCAYLRQNYHPFCSHWSCWVLMRVLEKGIAQAWARSYSSTVPTDISVQGGPIRGSKAILRFTVSRFPSSGQSVYFYGGLNHTFHCPCHKNDLRGSFGVCKNHCHNSLGKSFPLANEAKVQLNVRDYFPRLRFQGRPCLMSSYIYHFSA